MTKKNNTSESNINNDAPKLTESQKRYVNIESGNILVSAAAGSGKTSTLAQRVIHLLRDENYSLKEMIILTFTDLAANEMKERIIKELNKVKNDRIKDELKHIDEAYICTFDSFCSQFVRKYSCYSIFSNDFTMLLEVHDF